MTKTCKHKVINSKMTKQEIISIVQADFSLSSFERRFKETAKKLADKIFAEGHKTYTFSLIAKSGQKYNCCAYRVYNKHGLEEFYFGVFIYFAVHEDFGISYYTLTFPTGTNIFSMNPEQTEVNRFTDHAIRRYVERCGYDNLYGSEAFVKFFSENGVMDKLDTHLENEIIAKTRKGALVGRNVNGINHYNTFYNDDMVQQTKRFRDLYNESDLADNERFEHLKASINAMIEFFEKGKIKVTTFLSRMENLRNDITDEYLEYAETTRQQFDERIRSLIEKNTIRTDPAHRSTLPHQRKACQSIQSCIPGFQEGMQEDKRLIRRRLQNYFNYTGK